MIKAIVAPLLPAVLKRFKYLVKESCSQGDDGQKLIVFCEDRLSLAAERAVCEAVGGTFTVEVYTLSRFLANEGGKAENLLSSQGSAMAIQKLIDENKQKLSLFKRLSSANAAQDVYDTIALLYSCKISPEDLEQTEGASELLKRKLSDVALLYRAYSRFLKDTGATDRNVYLRRLAHVIENSPKIKGATVAFLGFNAFTSSVKDGLRACMKTAANVYGFFVGDRQGVGVYLNEALADFCGVAQELKTTVKPEYFPSELNPAAEHLRLNVFNPEIFAEGVKKSIAMDISPDESGFSGGFVSVTEAADEEEECRFVAAHVIKCVKRDGVSYKQISVMAPDLDKYQPVLERVFEEYGLPFYVDRRYPLIGHSVCSLALDLLGCAADGLKMQSVTSVVYNPLFCTGEEFAEECKSKDLFANYLLKAASSRGGVLRPVEEQACENFGEGAYQKISAVRERFLQCADLFSRQASGEDYCRALRSSFEILGVKETLERDGSDQAFKDYPAVAAMSARAFGAMEQVLAEAEKLTGGLRLTAREFARILKSGFTAAEVSLIPPKQNAVFVGDLFATANTGSEIIFVAGLTDAVPKASQDTSILTDNELNSLEKLKSVSPKISQVNMRVREITALNLCAFHKRLYLLYPLRSGGEECAVSEIIAYVKRLFSINGAPLSPVTAKKAANEWENIPYYCAKPAPAFMKVAQGGAGREERTVYAVLKKAAETDGRVNRALQGLFGGGEKEISLSGGARLFGNAVSPTALETYFSCPYKCFMQQGLRLEERQEGQLRPLDSGNFIHSVLEDVAKNLNGVDSEDECRALAEKIAEEKLSSPFFARALQDGKGEYTAAALVKEAVEISLGMYAQLAGSSFEISSTETPCEVSLDNGLKVFGRIDRVDSCGDMVRVIDYKTGSFDNSASAYYMGLKLQLPLYLSAAAKDKRAVGAYYFPAKTEYGAGANSPFCLKGFMDGSEDVIKCSDNLVGEKERSSFVDAYLNGRSVEGTLSREQFDSFVKYSLIIAGKGAESLRAGKIAPSPVEGTCKYCKFAGCCRYNAEERGERELKKINCEKVAEIARTVAGEEKL